jgi:hypothetical protein
VKGFRCAGCRQRFPLPSFAQVGLSQVCSAECATTVRQRSAQNRGGRQPANPPSPPRVRANLPGKGERANDVPVEVRAEVYLRDKARCRFCGTPAATVHHVLYRSQGGTHVEENLIVLCQEHHDLMHSNKKYWQPILLDLMRRLYEGQSCTVPQVERWLSS